MDLPSYNPLTLPEETDLLTRAKAGDTQAQNILIERSLRFVATIANKFAKSTPAISQDDLISEGVLGFIRAIERYDATRAKPGVSFIRYAAWWITAFIAREALLHRTLFTAPEKIRQLARKGRMTNILACVDQNVSPDELERSIARRAGVHIRGLAAIPLLNAKPAQPPFPGAPMPYEDVASETPLPDEILHKTKLQTIIAQALKRVKMNEREKFMLHRRLMAEPDEELTLQEIGDRFQVSRERVRQIEEVLLKKLRVALAKHR